MDILRHIAHDRVGTAAEAVVQGGVCRHAEILSFVDDHVARLAYAVCLFDPFVNVGEGCKVVEIEFMFRNGNRLPF